jgi:transposase
MAWTEITARHFRREGLRYESDTTDAEWFVMEPFLPPASALARPRATDMRTVINAILYIASTDCQWRQLPKDFPPYSTVQGYCYAWSRGGIFASLNYSLVMASREAVGREASPTAGVIESQSVKTTESGGPRAMTQARKSRAESATSSPIPKEIWSDSWCMKTAFKIAMAAPASLLHPLALSLAAPYLCRWWRGRR